VTPKAIMLPRRLNAANIEEYAQDIGVEATPISLRLDRLHRCEFMAESRLVSLLAHARHAGCDVGLVTKFEIDVGTGSAKRLVDLFTHTIGGLVLAQMAHSVIDASGEDRRPEVVLAQAMTAIESEGFFSFGSERAAPMVDLFGGPAPPEMVNARSGANFDSDFRQWLHGMRLPELSVVEEERKLVSLIDFAYETFDNTRRHAVRTLEGRPVEGVRFVLLRRVALDAQRSTDTAERVGPDPLADYLRRLADTLQRSTPVVELTIADCGPGIAATVARSAEIHQGPWDDEAQTVLAAFAKHKRSGSRQVGDRGLAKALRAVRELGGFVAVRTGRTQLTRDFHAGSATADDWVAQHFAYLPGSSLSCIFPWDAALDQLSL
jgi:hypothetical protein